MRSHEDSYAARGGFIDHLPELAPRDGINAAGRLIKEDYLRFMKYGYSESEFLSQPQWKGSDKCISVRGEAEPLKQCLAAGVRLTWRDPVPERY